jgi:hypothetical protein
MGQETKTKSIWATTRRIAQIDATATEIAGKNALSTGDRNRASEALRASLVDAAKHLYAAAFPDAARPQEEAVNERGETWEVAQARLTNAKAELLELQLAEQRSKSGLFYDPTTGDYLDKEGNVVRKVAVPVPVSEALETLASEFAGLQREVHKMARDAGHDVARAVAKAVATDSAKELLRAAEERGFQKAKDAALDIANKAFASCWALDGEATELHRVSVKIRDMKVEG